MGTMRAIFKQKYIIAIDSKSPYKIYLVDSIYRAKFRAIKNPTHN